MSIIPRREGYLTRKVRAARSTTNGIAGHQTAMSAIQRQTGFEFSPTDNQPGIGHVKTVGKGNK